MSELAPDILLPADAEVFRSAAGTLRIWQPAKGVLVTRVDGALTDEGGRAIDVAIRKRVAVDGRMVSFSDWGEMTDYSLATRLLLTKTAADVLKQTDGLHILVRSTIVSLGVQAANLVLKIITVHAERASLETALRDTLRKRRALADRPR